MSDDAEGPRPELRFGDHIEYYDSTDFATIAGEVANDAWVGVGDVMATLTVRHADGSTERKDLPVQVDNGPVTRGARVWLAVEQVTWFQHGEAVLTLDEVSGGDAGGAREWKVFYGPIRDPFAE